jgi:AraC-like DNA-binding protein
MGPATLHGRQGCDLEYGEHVPLSSLQDHVACIWVLRARQPLAEPVLDRVLPDTCMDVVFHRRGSTSTYEASLVGTMTRPMWVPMQGREDYIGIRFHPGGIRQFLDVPARGLADRLVPCEAVLGRTAGRLAEQLSEAKSPHQAVALLEGFLAAHRRPDVHDRTIEQAIRCIVDRAGNVPIPQLAHAAGCSERHLRRRFLEVVGVSPKMLSRIARFRRACRALRAGTAVDSLGAALDCGYYDQAHFIHEFRAFYGDAPSAFLRHRDT